MMLARKRRIAAERFGSYAAYRRHNTRQQAKRQGRQLSVRSTAEEIEASKLRRARLKLIRILRRIAVRHPEAVAKRRAKIAEKHRRKYRTDSRYVIYGRMRTAMRRLSARSGYSSKLWARRLGYSADQLRQHLEANFLPGMAWSNSRDWHIDHIRPVCSFYFTSPEEPQFRECYALSNLRPLWRKDNARKGGWWNGIDYRALARKNRNAGPGTTVAQAGDGERLARLAGGS
ncbi:MAG: hypothetical protein JSR67_03720 [Proteobacteria bacterium]|nr:hypothetical protein [Pseudomonadota bacterium]